MWRGGNVGGAISYAVIGRRRVFIFIQISARRLDIVFLESGHDTAIEETILRNDALNHGTLVLCEKKQNATPVNKKSVIEFIERKSVVCII